jgi:uncharacterized damage-inducible protein DinB
MNLSELIAQHLLDVHEGDNWTEVNLLSTLETVSFQEASKSTAASVNTIAGLVHHLTFWNSVMLQRLQGTHMEIPPSNGFDNAALPDEQSWYILKQQCLQSARALAYAISNLEIERLQEPILPGYPTAYKSLQGSVEHVHYHLGQIVILKQLIKTKK